jgi:hypothetical protein
MSGTDVSTRVDLGALELLNEVVEVDGQASSEEFFNPPLADDGDHEVVFKLGNRGVKVDRQWEGTGGARKRTGNGFLNVHLQLVGRDRYGKESGTIAFDNLSSIKMESSGTSRLHAAFDLAGFRLPDRASLGELKDAVERAIAQGPKAIVTTRWEAQVNEGTKDAPKYSTILKGQNKFPKKLGEDGAETGKYDPEVTDPKTGQTVRANVQVTKYGRA